MAQQVISTGTFTTAKWIVSSDITQGTHTTIAAALTSASSGDTIFIRPGTYTENLTLKAGVALCAYVCDAFEPNVIISGTCTFTAAGTVSISGIRLQTNNAALLAVTGSAASIVFLNLCFLNCTNNTGITFSSSDATSRIRMNSCRSDLTTTGIALFSHSSSGLMDVQNCNFSNSGGSSTASTCSAGAFDAYYSRFTFPITISSTGITTWEHCLISTAGQNVTSATLGGGSHSCKWCRFDSGSASAISIGSTIAQIEYCTVSSTNTNAITGAGTINTSHVSFENTSNTINTTTQTPLVSRFGVELSTTNPAFLGYLATQQNDKTGDGTVYTLGTAALTEVYDQHNDFTTAGTFTAPFTGKYDLFASSTVIGTTVATNLNLTIVTSNRNYLSQFARAASSANISTCLSVLADMDAADTFTCTVQTSGEAAATDDVYGASDLYTYMGGSLRC